MRNRDWDLERTLVRCEIQTYGSYLVWVVPLILIALGLGGYL